mgnify:CR=1 FL=1
MLSKRSTNKPSSWAHLMLSTEELLGLPIDELLVRLNTSRSGLASQEVKGRLEIYGYNELAKRKKRTVIVEFLFHLRNPLIIILLIAGLISGFFGEIINTAIIFSIVLLSVVLDVYQESKAEKAAELLKEKVATTATVLRDGVNQEVKFSEIFCKIISLLEKKNIDYLLIGGVAVGVWGKPRVTEDIDLIVFISKREKGKIIREGRLSGFKLKKETRPQFPEGSIFKLCYGIYHVDFIIASTELERSALERKVRVKIFGKYTFVPSKEDLLLLKIIPGRPIDISDAENIAQRHKSKLDEKYLLGWARKLSDEAEDMRIYNEIKRLLKL